MPGHPPTSDWPEWPLIHAERETLAAVIAECREHSARPLTTIYPMLDAAGSSTDTLISLARQHNIRDGYVVSRLVYETLVNCCFILAGGDPVAERAWLT